MSERIEEKELRIPALIVIKENPGITTSLLISKLNALLSPSGQDIQIIKGRKDTYFSQKVRNLVSHDFLKTHAAGIQNSKREGYSWTINETGMNFLNDNMEDANNISYVLNNTGFSQNERYKFVKTTAIHQKKIYIYDENEMINEGKKTERVTKIKTRSRKLREAAIKKYSINGKIYCAVCGFDCEKSYGGKLGKNIIEMHHIKPIYQYDDEDSNQVIKEAIKNLVPLCPNCHAMLHKNRELTFEEFKKEFDEYLAFLNKK